MEKLVVKGVNVTCCVLGLIVPGSASDDGRFPPLEWRCSDDHLPWGRVYEEVRVSCECLHHCTDDLVWRGSCALEYTMAYSSFWVLITMFAHEAMLLAVVAAVLIAVLLCCGKLHAAWKKVRRRGTRNRVSLTEVLLPQEETAPFA